MQTKNEAQACPICPVCGTDRIHDAKPTEPDPGEGWRLLVASERVRSGDEWLSSAGDWNPAHNHMTDSATQTHGLLYRRRIEPPAPEWDDVEFGRNAFDRLVYCNGHGMYFEHAFAVSEPGFIEYRYRHNGREWGSVWPVEREVKNGRAIFPHAWRRSKKGGAA